MDPQANAAASPLEQFRQDVKSELETSKKSLIEVSLMLEQSQAELSKLTQRNAAINARLKQIQDQQESAPRADIHMTYSAALDAQQRLLVMRAQLEKLQNNQEHLKRLATFLESTLKMLSGDDSLGAGGTHNSQAAVLEMVVEAQESERQRLSRQMHDGPAQALSNFIVQTDIASRLMEIDPQRAKEELTNLKSSATSTFQKVRDFIFNLRPMMLDDLGLFPTVRRYVDSLKEQNNLEVSLSITGQERRLQPYLEVMIFRALQELTGNVMRHNPDVRVKVKVQIALDETHARLTVSDNGKGFNPAVETSGYGLKLIHERVDLLGGSFEIDSAPGQGARVTFQIPCLEAA